MIELRTPAEIEAMKPAGRFVAEVLATLREETRVGTNLLEIDRRAHEMIRAAGAESCYIDYHPSFGASPFGKVICTSINDAVLHGLPHDYALRDGDLVTLDFAVAVDGWVADSAVSFVVGTPRDEDLALIDTTERALDAAIAAEMSPMRLPTTAATASVARCTGIRTSPTTGSPAAAIRSAPAWSLRSNPGSCSRPISCARMPTGGPCAAQTARGERTRSIRSRSRRTVRSSSLTGASSASTELDLEVQEPSEAPTVCTRTLLVDPAIPGGAPAVMITTSPG